MPPSSRSPLLCEFALPSGAVERQAARQLPNLVFASASEAAGQDLVLAGAMSADAADRCERHALARTRAFYRALHKLELIQSRRRQAGTDCQPLLPASFPDEPACEAYLAERFRRGARSCPRCGSTTGYFFPARRSWECAGCKTQLGLRFGTVMARSAVALTAWFEMVRVLLFRPTSSLTELAAKTGLGRVATVRSMARRIREAMARDDASEQLAGLDVHFGRGAGTS
jgi:transposase-like protein